ncbi:STAS/SEC14 domain-containing protein [Bremerella cremea]|uniref:STAS/SEC14 domain-containing protein n=1 Tax=Bremerella cremea TaxID=1031537 RepID=A0A368KVF6_9BACT|nr:STAS/SEC14 domain-containing protein [Bremerella cremea]RCS50548.1 STAS/SEC14 domain-containing protein [Bremerella cremea]
MSDNLEIVHLKDLTIVRISGKLTAEDYEKFVPEVEKQIAEFGKLRLLVELHDFHGWTLAAVWDDINFDMKHWNDIKRLAIVGESKWEAGMAVFCKPFTGAKVKYFDHSKLEQAKKWLVEEEA